MSQVPTPPVPCKSLTSQLQTVLTEKTEHLLARIIRDNFTTQYASQAPSLAEFRDVVSSHGTEFDATLLQDFRSHVPLMDYDSYKPFVAKFNEQPCKESEVENMFAPGLPRFLAGSSSTSGNAPKMFAKYDTVSHDMAPPRAMCELLEPKGPTVWLAYYGYSQLKEVEREPGQVVKRIPVCITTGGSIRRRFGWSVDDDEGRMATIVPGHVAPWATSMIIHHRSFLMMHALFTLACRDLDLFYAMFATLFLDIIRLLADEWDMLVTCIREGTIPDLDGIDHVRSHLQVHWHADPERATELREIGSPFSCVGWAARVWPKLRVVMAISSGTFSTALPKVRSVLGPTIPICSPGYGSTECQRIAFPYDLNDLDTFVLVAGEVFEFLHVAAEESHENLVQAWDLEVGEEYQIVATTKGGLWRYPLGDVVEIAGFDPETGSPVFRYSRRTSLCMRLLPMTLTDSHLVASIKTISSEDIIEVHEFTTIVDDRKFPATVGCFIEGALGPNSHLAAQRLFDALFSANIAGPNAAFFHDLTPTIRIVKPGTFMEYRRWRGEQMNVGAGQIKVPVVLSDSAAQEWVVERVVQEL
ncbi:GH3 auxin-responsive promoter [Melanogaster broomeanus]|nr:GH3 auxin-responsive promoter [Melanogaster broomeanus]